MQDNNRTTVRIAARPVHLATFFSLAFFSAGIITYASSPGRLAQHVVFTGIAFLCIWTACRLIADSFNRRLRLESVDARSAGDMLYTFVIYLELVKHVVGVSFTLGWIAGTMFTWEHLGNQFIIVPIAASLAISLICFAVTSGLCNFVDQLRWPEPKK